MSSLALVGATVIDGTGRQPLPDMVVVIDDGHISALFRSGERELPEAAVPVEMRGKFVMPGLIDSHAHVQVLATVPQPEQAARPVLDDFMAANLAAGITTVRDTGGPDLDDSFVTLQRQRSDWPRFFGSGPNLDGLPGGPWPGMWKTDNPSVARDMVKREADGGVDFIKVYAWMDELVLTAVLDQAHACGLLVAGHVGYATTVKRAVQLGIDALEHIRIGPELVPHEHRAEFAALPHRYHDECASHRAWRYVDLESRATDELIELLLERDVVITPTLYLTKHLLTSEPGAGAQLDETGLLDGLEDERITRDYSAEDFEWAPREYQRTAAFVSRLHEAGVHLAAGTDSPSAGVLPGVSLHHEMATLVACGMTPMEAIRSATSLGARLLRRTDSLGSIRTGFDADLVVLREDPSVSLEALGSIECVFRAGEQVWSSAGDVGTNGKRS